MPRLRPSALLVVFQDAGLRAALTQALRLEGFGVVLASSTEEALAILRAGAILPTALVYDLHPAEGRELQNALAEEPGWSGIPQLAFADATDRGQRWSHVEAPISFTELVFQIRRITGGLH